jgi:hypothetical protein
MAVVFEARHFEIVAPVQPHVSRADGGHLIIHPKTSVEDRTQLSREQAIELVKLTMVAGEVMKNVLTRRGIDIGRTTIRTTATGEASSTCTYTAVLEARRFSRIVSR